MSLSKQRLLIAAALTSVVVLCAVALLPALARPSNCGGNSAALGACLNVCIGFRLAASDKENQVVSLSDLGEDDRVYFIGAKSPWLHEARILVNPAKIRFGEKPLKEIVAVCDTPFDNVPRRRFGREPLTHAVAYADGSTGLLTVGEFRQLDLSNFVDARVIYRGNVEPSGPANGSQPFRSETNSTSSAAGSRR